MTVYAVCGGRKFGDRTLLFRELGTRRDVTAIVHGKARGADTLAGIWAWKHGIPVITVEAQWDFYNKNAGHRRNGWILDFVKVDVLLAFPGGAGTADMIRQARMREIPIEKVGW